MRSHFLARTKNSGVPLFPSPAEPAEEINASLIGVIIFYDTA
jgi:hypothetical protein